MSFLKKENIESNLKEHLREYQQGLVNNSYDDEQFVVVPRYPPIDWVGGKIYEGASLQE